MNGVWGTVCDDDWDLRHANVVCRELGYSGARRATKKGHFGRGQGPVWLDDVRCTGAESSLFSCGRASSQVNDCGHNEDAGAVCTGLPIRLTNTYSGRLEVYRGGKWGTVCEERWDILEARVICRQMGYASAIRVFRARDTSPGGGPIHMTQVNCTGNEADFFSCPFNVPDKRTCTHAMDVGLECGTAHCSDC
ncbi:neurotrypsin-like [Liolophura sinensis]|uniref:neurotrypsin-like n=1 Tax=Liolophura sinensis TaxID=3198878 RepID=UPI003158DFB0